MSLANRWRPQEIIINEAVRNDPVTLHILSQCPGVSVKYVPDSKPQTIKAASDILSVPHDGVLSMITRGKLVMHITPASNSVLDHFDMPDHRMVCPEFDKLVLASNGCYYNCDWCFLKGTYRGAQNFITVRVQYDQIKNKLLNKLSKATSPILFDTGEMADSLAMEHLTKSAQEFIPWFAEQENGRMYMLTKSDNVDDILSLEHNGHTVLAWSLNAPSISERFEIGAPSFERRLSAAKKAQKAGYPIRVRLDPIVPLPEVRDEYAETIKRIFEEIKPERITLGTLRFEEQLVKSRNKIINDATLKKIMGDLKAMFSTITLPNGKKSSGKFSFSSTARINMFQFAINEIRKYSLCDIALCKESAEVWNAVGLDLKECKCVCQFDSADMINRPEQEVVEIATTKKAASKSKAKTAKATAKKSLKNVTVTETAGPTRRLSDDTYEPRKLYELEIDLLAPDPNQPRKSIDAEELAELKNSIVKLDVLLPIIFRKDESGYLFIVSGERRYLASKLAGKTTIPAIYIESNTSEIALVENLLRVDLTAIEEAEALQRLKTEARYTNEQIAEFIGKAPNTISEILKLNQLPEKLRNENRSNKLLSRRVLLEVAKADTPEEMKKLFKKALNKTKKRDEIRADRTSKRAVDIVCRTMCHSL